MDAKGYHAVEAMAQLLSVCGSSIHLGFSIEKPRAGRAMLFRTKWLHTSG